jgi:heptaprenyl diphosphate synthase/octaprenyl-diphosphate synthase
MNDIYKPVQSDLEKVEQALEATTHAEFPLLTELLAYALNSGGKRIRPALALLSGKFYQYDVSLLVPMAAAAELLHTATLVHDDIIDHSQVRRSRPTVSRAYGENRALLLGDYLFAKAGRLCADTDNLRVIKLFSQTLMTISGGELRQTAFVFQLGGARDYYYSWISAKTACLFSLSTESGAILSQAPEDVIKALRNYGHYFGMAFQVVDDVLDFVGNETEVGKPVGSDLNEGAVTLPTILYAESHPEENALIRKAIETRDAKLVTSIVEMVRTSPVIAQCLDIAADLSSRAREALDILPDSSARRSLVALANYVVQRRK